MPLPEPPAPPAPQCPPSPAPEGPAPAPVPGGSVQPWHGCISLMPPTHPAYSHGACPALQAPCVRAPCTDAIEVHTSQRTPSCDACCYSSCFRPCPAALRRQTFRSSCKSAAASSFSRVQSTRISTGTAPASPAPASPARAGLTAPCPCPCASAAPLSLSGARGAWPADGASPGARWLVICSGHAWTRSGQARSELRPEDGSQKRICMRHPYNTHACFPRKTQSLTWCNVSARPRSL